jgi:hypothetical protein
MGQAFNAMFAFFFMMFSAAEKGASAVNNLATWADESSGVFVDEARFNRSEKIKQQAAAAALTNNATPTP